MLYDTQPNDRWDKAIAHLKKDRVLCRLIDQVGPCTLRPKRNVFLKLVQSIVSQQVSTKAAASIYKKLAARFPRHRITPEALHQFLTKSKEEVLSTCGLSRQKRGYMIDLAQRFKDGQIPVKKFSRMTDEQIIESLVPIKGIGKWTVEMLLIFGLSRADVWPVDDLGLQEAIRAHFKLKERPKPKEILNLADKWRPYRSIATWYLWRAEKPKLKSGK